jgi:retron-type reverse transcriptase
LLNILRRKFPDRVQSIGLLSNLLETSKLFLDGIYLECDTGVPQGGILSPLLFNLYMEEILRNVKERCSGKLGRLFWDQVLAYADDIVFLFRNVGEAVELVKNFQAVLRNFNLKIGWKKSGVMAESEGIIKQVQRTLSDVFTDVDLPSASRGYRYLGCHIKW